MPIMSDGTVKMAAGELVKAEEYLTLLEQINDELHRRDGGPISYGDISDNTIEFTDPVDDEEYVTVDAINTLISGLSIISSEGLPDEIEYDEDNPPYIKPEQINQIQVVLSAKQSQPYGARTNNDCANLCSGMCVDSCATVCGATCEGTCKDECLDTCLDSCSSTCKGGCSSGCKGTCTGNCSGCRGCTGSCATCQNHCSNDCNDTCKGGCTTQCARIGWAG